MTPICNLNVSLNIIYMINKLFTERYRPSTLDELIVPMRIKQYVSKGIVQNCMFYGSHGIGKTSTSYIMAQGHPTKYINISDESSVETIRTTIENFCSTTQVGSTLDENGNHKLKVVILDEIDGASDQFFKALRGTIEKFHKVARFVATCNYLSKVPEAVQDRFEPINFNILNQDEEREIKLTIARRLKVICEENSISIDREALIKFTELNFPSVRKMISKVENWHIRGISHINEVEILKLNYIYDDLYQKIFDKSISSWDLQQFFQTNYSTKIDEVLVSFREDFPQWVKNNKPEYLEMILGVTITETCKHQYMRKFVIDPLIVPLSLIFLIRSSIK